MKKILFYVVALSLLVFSTVSYAQSKSKTTSFGKKIDEKNAIEATTLSKQLEGKESLQVKVKGKIKEVCQRKGCWMNVDIGDGKEMKVRFKDYAFFVPKDAAGKTVVMEGLATVEEVPVGELKHYAEDAGRSKEEIEKINKPEKNTIFEASGVLIYND